MILETGNIFRSFAEQKSFSFNSSISISNTSGNSSISVSGDGGRFGLFSFKSGRVYDPINRFVGGYSSNESLNISGNFSSGNFAYFINKEAICLNVPVCSNSLSFDNLFFSTTGSNMDISIDIFGNTVPNYDVKFPSYVPITGDRVTGYLKNTSPSAFQSFKIFSGNSYFPYDDYSLLTNLSGLKIKPNNSGALVFGFGSGTTFLLDSRKQAYPLTGNLYLDTNFGYLNIPISTPLKSSPAYFIDFQQTSYGLSGTTGKFWSYELQRQACSGTRFEFKFDDVFWAEQSPSLFSNRIFIETGYNNGNYIGSLVPYNVSKTAYIGTGYISGAGCYDDIIFNTKFNISHYIPDGSQLSNKFAYFVSGIDENFLFSGLIE